MSFYSSSLPANQACFAFDPLERPTFEEVVDELLKARLEASLQGQGDNLSRSLRALSSHLRSVLLVP